MNVAIDRNVSLTRAQAKAVYRWTGEYLNKKPVFWIPTKRILTLKSGFKHKQLCDGPTFTLGLACGFGCLFCYVDNQLSRNPTILRIRKETGLDFQQIIIEKDAPLPILRGELVNRRGKAKYPDLADARTVFASPLVDVAANLPAALQTIKACRLILENTHWQIRLLSKSAMLKMIAEALGDYRERVIYGLSTGTLDDRLAASFEVHTSSPTARFRTLHWLQDNGFRTYGMLCPSLPQDDYDAFARAAAEAVRVDRCEHVWAEVLNVRGKSLAKTCAGLFQGGLPSLNRVESQSSRS